MQTEIEGATATQLHTPPLFQDKHLHMIGIGGSGMSAAAMMLLKLGATVTGSDLEVFDGLGSLVKNGARIEIGQQRSPIDPDLDWVVHSAAVAETNFELSTARKLGVRTIKYAELVGMLMTQYRGIAIAGTHGKSTTTAMTAHLFREAGLSPSYIIGARSQQLGGASDVGTGEHFILESCEYDRSFLHVHPESAVILNMETDHMDCYRDLDDIVDAFSSFASNVEPDGLLICNADDELVNKASKAAHCNVETFGLNSSAHWHATNLKMDCGCYAFDVQYRGSVLFSTKLSIAGLYNVYNVLAAIALTYHAGAHCQYLAEAVTSFAGIDRRLCFKGESNGITIVDDYAHHPTEIKVTLEAAKNRYQPRRTWVIFQPHQFARTQHFMDQFVDSLVDADEIIIPDVYGARESDEQACRRGAQEMAEKICKKGKHAQHLSSFTDVTDYLIEHITEGDLVMTMGAGDVWKISDELVERICGPNRA